MEQLDRVVELDVRSVVPGDNDRKDFEEAGLQELARSIAENGLAQPITVRPLGAMFEVVAGERRFRAVRDILDYPTIKAIIRELSDEEASSIMLVENVARRDLNPIEEAKAYLKRCQQFGWTAERVAEVVGVSVALVKRRVSLLGLADDVQFLVTKGQFPVGHAEAMAALDVNRQHIAIKLYVESGGMPLAKFRSLTGQLFQQQSQQALFGVEEFWMQQIEATKGKAMRGKGAELDVPLRNDLPPIKLGITDTTTGIINRYIKELESQGFTPEAAALGTLYQALVQGNFLAVPEPVVMLGMNGQVH